MNKIIFALKMSIVKKKNKVIQENYFCMSENMSYYLKK